MVLFIQEFKVNEEPAPSFSTVRKWLAEFKINLTFLEDDSLVKREYDCGQSKFQGV